MGFFDKIFGRKDLTLREARFAGLLYPKDEDELREQVEALLAQGQKRATSEVEGRRAEAPRALIVPQGDFGFAGEVMADGWASLIGLSKKIERVVLVGSSRLVPFRGLAVTGYDGFETPLGPVVFDREAIESLAGLEQVRPIEPAFDPEASLEAQLPFLREVLGEVSVVPLLVGDARDEQVEEALSLLVDDPATLLVVSANLSDDVAFERAEALDEQTAAAIESLDWEQIERQHSNARVAIRGLLRLAKARGWSAKTLSRQTSAQTAGETSGPVTGYGAFAFSGGPGT